MLFGLIMLICYWLFGTFLIISTLTFFRKLYKCRRSKTMFLAFQSLVPAPEIVLLAISAAFDLKRPVYARTLLPSSLTVHFVVVYVTKQFTFISIGTTGVEVQVRLVIASRQVFTMDHITSDSSLLSTGGSHRRYNLLCPSAFRITFLANFINA